MTTAKVGTLPAGSRGFDCNERVSEFAARAFRDAGYSFVVRYVRRHDAHDYDLSVPELLGLLKAGLGVMVVQHVAALKGGWFPKQGLGTNYGTVAAEEAARVGVPHGVTLWCDLEDVSPNATAADVIAFCNAWYDAVRKAGFDAGLYVGFNCGLTAKQLYYSLRFRRYWAAYNLNRDSYPFERGVCMQQGPYPPKANRVKGVSFEYDTNVVQLDGFSNLPSALLPGDPG